MASYSGTLTSTGGSSKAIRLDKDLFRQHPEFENKKYRADVIAPGKLLLSVTEEVIAAEADPVLDAFLAFLADDIKKHPERIQPVSQAKITKAKGLLKNVIVSDDEPISDEVSL